MRVFCAREQFEKVKCNHEDPRFAYRTEYAGVLNRSKALETSVARFPAKTRIIVTPEVTINRMSRAKICKKDK